MDLVQLYISANCAKKKLQRLPQSLFQLRAIGSADFRSRTVFQDHFEFAMRDWLEAQDAFDIDNSRAMDADKTNWVEFLSKLIQRGPVQQLLPPACGFA